MDVSHISDGYIDKAHLSPYFITNQLCPLLINYITEINHHMRALVNVQEEPHKQLELILNQVQSLAQQIKHLLPHRDDNPEQSIDKKVDAGEVRNFKTISTEKANKI